MFKLSRGYLLTGIITGLIVLFSFFASLPDGKLHLVFCNVGQGDAAYVRFPDGRDMLIDGGPSDKVLACLGKHMPFWDRKIDLVVLSHPQADHLSGLLSVLERFQVGYFIRSDVDNPTEGFTKLKNLVKQKKIPEKLVTVGENVKVGSVNLSILWPSEEQIAQMKPFSSNLNDVSVLGTSAPTNLNDGSVVLWLRYGSFDALFPGDADNHVNAGFISSPLAGDILEVLKVPHHGSKTGLSEAMLNWLHPQLAVISVGKNSYGHPAGEILKMLEDKSIEVLRTDLPAQAGEGGDVEVVSDGKNWDVMAPKGR